MITGFSQEALAQLRPCDVIYTQSTSFVSKGIRKFSGGWPSHTEMVLVPNDMMGAAAKGVRKASIHTLDNPSGHAVAFRVPGLTERDWARVISDALSDEGEPYPYPKVFVLQFVDAVVFRGRYVTRRFAVSPYNYCNAAVQKWLRKASTSEALFPWDLDQGQPDDMMSEQVRRGHPLVWASSDEAVASVLSQYKRISI
jgi:hypothetical protein